MYLNSLYRPNSTSFEPKGKEQSDVKYCSKLRNLHKTSITEHYRIKNA